MAIEGTLISRRFINLLIRHALPAKAQLVLVDSLTGDILYPYDVSNYYGNVEQGFVDIDGEPYFANQSIPKEIPYNQGKVAFDSGDFASITGAFVATGKTYEFNIAESILATYKDNDKTKTVATMPFDPSDPSSGWSLDFVQLDNNNDPSGPPLVHHMNPEFLPTSSDVSKVNQSWTWQFFNFDPSSGKVSFQLLLNENYSFPINATYTSGDPSSYFRFTWDVVLIDKVRNVPKSRARFNTLMGHLPKI